MVAMPPPTSAEEEVEAAKFLAGMYNQPPPAEADIAAIYQKWGQPMPATSSVAAAPVTTSPAYYQQPMPAMAYYSPTYPAVGAITGLDHSQGKWFAPGEPLPAGWVVSAHPEGNTAPVAGQQMSEMASQSFVITNGTGAAAETAPATKDLPAATTSKAKASKKSKKKKSSGCC
eukprot:TRINITY_DN7780_c1_g1_i1.p1 TRINITY_DN7780_c1_g1~~TRINITY_DN7780_c1_g1_i1.p1  ORF type:complete len:173 (-),score=46.30 TRINITY_DN7780_c1_g1_i1:43-561(-)